MFARVKGGLGVKPISRSPWTIERDRLAWTAPNAAIEIVYSCRDDHSSKERAFAVAIYYYDYYETNYLTSWTLTLRDSSSSA